MAKDISRARKKATDTICAVLDDLDKTGFNGKRTRVMLNKMGDREFIRFMERMRNEDDYNFCFEIDSYGPDGAPDVDRIEKVAKKYGVKLREHVIMPHRNPGGPPVVTKDPVPIIYVQVKRYQQMLDKKNSIAGTNDKINPITGQVTGSDKGASLSDLETYTLVATNQYDTIKEFLGPRADDSYSKQQMLTAIERDGKVSIKDLDIRTGNKQSIKTAEAFMKGAMIDMRFYRREEHFTEKKTD